MKEKRRFGKVGLRRFPISLREARALFRQLRRAWRYEELVPQPEGYILIPLRRIQPPKRPIREKLGDLEGLKASIKREGVVEPIVVRPSDRRWRRFEVVIGLRRLTASEELGVDRIPAIIREYGDERIAALALLENVQRKDLTQPEMLHAMLIMRESGYTIERIAEASGVDPAVVSACLRIREFPKPVRDALLSGEISLSHFRALARLEDKQMLELLRRIKAEGLSKSDAEILVLSMRGKVELPSFFEPREFMRLLGRNLEFRRGKRSMSLTIRASDEREMAKVLGKILKFNLLK